MQNDVMFIVIWKKIEIVLILNFESSFVYFTHDRIVLHVAMPTCVAVHPSTSVARCIEEFLQSRFFICDVIFFWQHCSVYPYSVIYQINLFINPLWLKWLYDYNVWHYLIQTLFDVTNIVEVVTQNQFCVPFLFTCMQHNHHGCDSWLWHMIVLIKSSCPIFPSLSSEQNKTQDMLIMCPFQLRLIIGSIFLCRKMWIL